MQAGLMDQAGFTLIFPGVDPGEVKWVSFHPPFSEPPSFFLSFFYPSNIEIIFDFSDIITKIHPPFQNPGSALDFALSPPLFPMSLSHDNIDKACFNIDCKLN